MKDRPTLKADVFRFAVAAVFLAMTMAFLTIPYALSAHPGDPSAPVATAAARHLS
jgi:hypothetical protein